MVMTTTNTKEALGLPCTYKIIHPDMCLVVGSNLSQKSDGHVGGRKVMCEKHCTTQDQLQHKEKNFTLLGFTSLSGDPVLCLIIIARVKEDYLLKLVLTRLPSQQEMLPTRIF